MRIRSFAAATAARLVLAAFAILALSAAAQAQFLTFVAATGNDGNSCLVQAAPCRTLQRAIDATAANGTVRLLSHLAASNGVINKSITIDGGGNTNIGTIAINSASAVVALRNLALTGRGAVTRGINIVSAAAVHIEDCTVERYTGDGIRLSATTATRLFVSDTVSRDNGGSGLLASDVNARVTVADSRFEKNGNTGLVLSVAKANVTRSIASGNVTGVYMSVGEMSLTETTAAENSSYGFYVATLPGATLAFSVANGNGTGLAVVSGVAVITDSVLTENTTGIDNAGVVVTRENNTLLNNFTNYTGAGTISPNPGF